jgi:hypothetical protein
VADVLAKYPEAGLEEVMHVLQLSKRRIQRTSAWKQAQERRLDQYLREHPQARSGDVYQRFGFSPAKLTHMTAWQEHRRRQDAARPDAKLKVRPLTKSMLICRPDDRAVDPTLAIDAQDTLAHSLLKAADDATRRQLQQLAPDQQQALLVCLCQSLNFDATTDAPPPAAELLLETAKSWLEDQDDERRHAQWRSR